MPFVNVYYPENILNKEKLKKVSECIHLSLMDHFNIPENDYLLERGEKGTENMISLY